MLIAHIKGLDKTCRAPRMSWKSYPGNIVFADEENSTEIRLFIHTESSFDKLAHPAEQKKSVLRFYPAS